MRYPIQRQLLWPMLQVVVLCSTVTALLSAWLGMRSIRLAEEQRLQQLSATLTDAGFPLTDGVLQRMSELSAAEFVTLDRTGRLLQTSRPISAGDAEQFSSLPIESEYRAGAARPLGLEFGSYRALRIPIRLLSRSDQSSLVILTSQARWNSQAWQAALPPLIAGLLAAWGASLWAWSLSQQFVSRLYLLLLRAEQIAEGQFQSEALPPVDDELRDLAAALNRTAEKLTQYEHQVRTGERLKTLGQIGAGMAHQLRNAITGARMALDLHASELPKTVDRESLTVAARQMALMESYLQRFLTLGRGDRPAFQELELSTIVTEARQLVDPLCRHHGIQLAWNPPTTTMLMQGDADSLRQMLLNLLMNAIEAVQPLPEAERQIGVELSHSSSLRPRGGEGGRRPDEEASGPKEEERGLVVIQVWDQGPGPAKEIAPTLFDRFVTDKPDGTGLGLAVAQEIARTHGGGIQWRRNEGRTVFEVTLACQPAGKP